MFGNGKWGRRNVGDTLKQWPKQADGELEPPVFLCHSSGVQMTDVITVSMLQSFGIPCVQMKHGAQEIGEIVLGVNIMGADLFVPQSMYEEAKALLEGESDNEDI